MATGKPGRLAVESSTNEVVRKVQSLDGLELVMLLGILAKEHCLVQAPPLGLDSCAETIEAVAARTFGLTAVRIDCTGSMTPEAFANGLLMNNERNDRSHRNPPVRRASYMAEHFPSESSRAIANVIVAKDLEKAPHLVQMQALELIRTRRISAHSDIYSAPTPFLFIPLTASSSQPLANHLNDFLFMSYCHRTAQVQDDETATDQSDSLQDVNHQSSAVKETAWSGPVITPSDIQHLNQQREETTLTVEMKRYLHNVLIFLRMHRGIAGGVTAKASRDFDCLTRCLAPLNDLSFVTPSLVALAAKKVYPHRLKLASVDQERSMQYGSDAAAVAKALEGLTPEIIIEQVLQEVEVPL